MSQRVRAHTTGATPTPDSPKSGKTRKASKKAPTTNVEDGDFSATASSDLSADLPATDHSPAPDGLPEIAAPALARVLRAIAQEIERDPSLAQRVAASITSPDTPTPPEQPERASIQAQPSTMDVAGAPVEMASDGTDAVSGGRVNRAFHPRIVTGIAAELGPGVPDPFALYARVGEAGLRATLDELRLGSLRAIVRAHRLDPSGRLAKQNDAAKLRTLIIGAVLAREQAPE